eukprot:Em0002g267a
MFIREVKEASTHQKELVSMVMLRQGPRRLNGGASTSAFYGTPPAVHSRTTWLPGEGRIREVYNNLGEELHFRLDEGIDSAFNKKIVSLVAAEFDKDHCPIATVKAGLVTYKRTLKRALTSNDSASRRVKRSRQQRSRPADILLQNWNLGRPVALDISVVSPLNPSTLAEATIIFNVFTIAIVFSSTTIFNAFTIAIVFSIFNVFTIAIAFTSASAPANIAFTKAIVHSNVTVVTDTQRLVI